MSSDFPTDAVQAVTEAMHADLCPDDDCGGGDMGECERQAEIAVATARPHIEAQALREAAAYLDTRPNGSMFTGPVEDCYSGDLGFYGEAQWLRERADQIEREGQSADGHTWADVTEYGDRHRHYTCTRCPATKTVEHHQEDQP